MHPSYFLASKGKFKLSTIFQTSYKLLFLLLFLIFAQLYDESVDVLTYSLVGRPQGFFMSTGLWILPKENNSAQVAPSSFWSSFHFFLFSLYIVSIAFKKIAHLYQQNHPKDVTVLCAWIIQYACDKLKFEHMEKHQVIKHIMNRESIFLEMVYPPCL